MYFKETFTRMKFEKIEDGLKKVGLKFERCLIEIEWNFKDTSSEFSNFA